MKISDELIERIKRNDPALTNLIFSGRPLMISDLERVAAALANNTVVKSLELCMVALEDAAIPIIAQCLNIERLLLNNNKITSAGLEVLVALPLKELSLNGNPLGRGAGAVLARNQTILRLHMRGTLVDEEDIRDLAQNRTLRVVYLGNNTISEQALALLAGMPLEFLELSACKLGPKAASILSTNPYLQSLDLSVNELGDAGAEYLAHHPGSLVALDVSVNNMTERGISALLAQTGLKKICPKGNMLDGATERRLYDANRVVLNRWSICAEWERINVQSKDRESDDLSNLSLNFAV